MNFHSSQLTHLQSTGTLDSIDTDDTGDKLTTNDCVIFVSPRRPCDMTLSSVGHFKYVLKTAGLGGDLVL